MADVTDLNIAYIAAGAALLGATLGPIVPWLLNLLTDSIKQRKESKYLAILVVAHLDRFVMRCTGVALDDGTVEGQPAGDNGFYQATIDPPEFAPLELEVDWKVLPSDLMMDVLDIPRQQHLIATRLTAIGEWDEPPEYAEYFWARQEAYADLGLKVSDIASKLRKLAGMKIDQSKPGDWNRDQMLRDQGARVNAEREAYHQRVNATPSTDVMG